MLLHVAALPKSRCGSGGLRTRNKGIRPRAQQRDGRETAGRWKRQGSGEKGATVCPFFYVLLVYLFLFTSLSVGSVRRGNRLSLSLSVGNNACSASVWACCAEQRPSSKKVRLPLDCDRLAQMLFQTSIRCSKKTATLLGNMPMGQGQESAAENPLYHPLHANALARLTCCAARTERATDAHDGTVQGPH